MAFAFILVLGMLVTGTRFGGWIWSEVNC